MLWPRLMPVAGSPEDNPAFMTRAYAFYVEGRDSKDPVALQWRPGSYAEAEAGIVRSTITDEVRSYGLAAIQGGGDSDDVLLQEQIRLVVTRAPVLIVVVDPVNKIYGWRVIDYDVPMPRLDIELAFKLWQPTPYTDLEWTFDK